jgi:hypothetical protein
VIADSLEHIFIFGVTGGTKLMGHEYQGVLLVIFIMCCMKESRLLFFTKISNPVLYQRTCLF